LDKFSRSPLLPFLAGATFSSYCSRIGFRLAESEVVHQCFPFSCFSCASRVVKRWFLSHTFLFLNF
jgi:hypothetical protein